MIPEALLAHAAIAGGLALLAGAAAAQFPRLAKPERLFCLSIIGFAGLALWRLADPGPLAWWLAGLALVLALTLAVGLAAAERRRGLDDAADGPAWSAAAFAVAAGFLVSLPSQYGILEAGSFQPISGLALLGGVLVAVGLAWVAARGAPRGIVLAAWGGWLAAASAGWWVAASTVVAPLWLSCRLWRTH